MAELPIPALSLVVLIGPTSAGKSTFAARAFGPHETVSSDACRALVANDPNDQAATTAAFEVLHLIVAKRLAAGLLTVVDATNTQPAARQALIATAREHDVLPVAIVFDLPEAVLLERHRERTDRPFGEQVVKRQHNELRRSLKGLSHQGFRHIHRLTTPDEADQAVIRRTPLFNDRRFDHGPFDVIGDVHGCLDELTALLGRLGYRLADGPDGPADAVHPDGRRVVFLGDLVDRGPDSVGVLRLAMGMTAAGHALAVPGNHEAKLVRALGRGGPVTTGHGLAETLAALEVAGTEFTAAALAWCGGLVSHYVLDAGRLVVAHAGLKEAYQGRASARVRAFALYGDPTGESDEDGLPVRYPWADDYRGSAMVLYGHTPVAKPVWVNRTLCLDTGCVFGGALTALRYPERELVSEPAARVYCQPARPLRPAAPAAGRRELDIADVLGKRVVETRWMGRVTIQADQAAGALEVISRFAAAPERLGYLPPTMSPVAASALPDWLEHPAEAFDYFAAAGVDEVMCEEKHMGSRAVVWVWRDGGGIVHTRTGRPGFSRADEPAVLQRIADAVAAAGLWDELDAAWLMWDAELLPWSYKAADLVRRHYAPVGAAAAALYGAVVPALEQGAERGLDLADELAHARHRQAAAAAYAEVVARFGAPGPARLAPFQLLAADSGVRYGESHRWHLALADRLVAADPGFFTPTRRQTVTLADPASRAAATAWWEDLTDGGAEGMVAKPMTSPLRVPKGLVQPGLKVRGRDYLRLTYGPDYLDQLDDLKHRHLGAKRSLALREYALGLEALDRLTAGEPLWRVHECVVGVLALESDPVDPRL